MSYSLVLIIAGLGSDGAAEIDFDRGVRPILASHCLECHGAKKQEGGYRLDRGARALQGGDNYAPAIVPGKSAESPLVDFIAREDADLTMPPEGPRLSEKEVTTIRKWIDEGAKWGKEAKDAEEPAHWSLSPVRRPEWSIPISSRVETPIDALIHARLAKEGLAPSEEADRRTMIRRASYDLIGLPPSPGEIDRFLSDPADDAYHRLIDRLLSSPHHGERYARHWLDVVRFAETNGFEMNQPRPNAWPYRDYVIESFNTDKPYDRFVVEQLAGDTQGVDSATGFLVAGPWDQVKSPDPVLTAQQRADELHDMVNATGSAFLGLTVGCARCHSHKFDPIPQADYYSMKAVFEGVQHGERTMTTSSVAKDKQRAEDIRKEIAQAEAELDVTEPLAGESTRSPVKTTRNLDRFAPVEARFVRFTISATNQSEPCLDELEVFSADDHRNIALASAGGVPTASGTFPNSDIHRLEHINDGRYGNERSWISNESGKGWVQIEWPTATRVDGVAWSRDRVEPPRYNDRLAIGYEIAVSLDGQHWTAVADSKDRRQAGLEIPIELNPKRAGIQSRLSQLRSELKTLISEPMVYAGKFEAPGPTFRFHRGDPMQPKEEVPPGALSAVSATEPYAPASTEPERRLALARWMVDARNPLTPRVIVNRLWHHHLGEGIVNTPSDFGVGGAKPSMPEVLDWLASEVLDSNWRLKDVHRQIVSSAIYRQSSAADPEGMAKDAGTRWLWRYPPRRIEAEIIRDAVLSVSGNIDLRMGGPGFSLFEPNDNYVRVYNSRRSFGPDEWRRMVYQTKPRMQLDDTFGAFDCPDGGQIAPKRSRSTTPLQSLNLLNSPFLIEQSAILTHRLEAEAPSSLSEQVRLAFRLAFGREATKEEVDASVRLIEKEGLPIFCRAIFNANEFLMVY